MKHSILPALFLMVLLVGVMGFASLAVVGLRSLNVGDEMSLGYEGGKAFWEGVDIQPDGRYGASQITWRIGEPIPSDVAEWLFNRGTFNLDPKGDSSQWQNLIGITELSGEFEQRLGQILYLENEWDVVVSQNTTDKVVKHVVARDYFSMVSLEIKPRVDESGGWWGVGVSTEKNDYWRDFTLGVLVHVNNWSPDGNSSSWARLLGVEVADTEIMISGKGSDAVRIDTGFFKGQMLPMYRSWESLVGKSGGQSGVKASSSQLNSLAGQPVTVPSNDLTDTVYVPLSFSAFGIEADRAGGIFPDVQYRVTLRIHILKADEWIAVQKVGTPTDWSDVKRSQHGGFWASLTDLGGFLSSPFGLLTAGVIGLIAVVVLLLIFTPLGAVAGIWALRKARG